MPANSQTGKKMTEGSNLQIPRLAGGFQAKTQEWDYVILSTVRSTPGGLGALEDEHLLDVALTRARHGAGALCGWLGFG